MSLSKTFWKNKRVTVTGGEGFLGSSLMRALQAAGARTSTVSRATGYDLRDLNQATRAFKKEQPDIVINAASNQGGLAYQKIAPGQIFYDNLLMGTNTMEAARVCGVRKYVNVIAGCAYPGDPRDGILRENEFEAGPMHPTVENYGATKRAAYSQARAYHKQYGMEVLSLIAVNLYGPGEHFHPDRSHALAALLRKFYEAKQNNQKEVVLWGTGRAVREWLFVEDATMGILRATEVYNKPELLNIAVGQGLTIGQLAETISKIVGYTGKIKFDTTKPDGAIHKVADISRMKSELNWTPQTSLEDGIRQTLDWLTTHYQDILKEAA